MWVPWGGPGKRCWRRGSCCSSPSWAQSCTGHTPYCPMFWLPAYDQVDKYRRLVLIWLSFLVIPIIIVLWIHFSTLTGYLWCCLNLLHRIFHSLDSVLPRSWRWQGSLQSSWGEYQWLFKQRFTAKLLPYEDCWHQQPVSPLHPELGLTSLLQSKVRTAMTVVMLTKQWCDVMGPT